MLIHNVNFEKRKHIYYNNRSRDYAMPEYHYHNHYEIYFMVYGNCKFSVENQLYTIEKNNMLIIPPGLIHRADDYTEKSKRIIISFPKALLDFEFDKELSAFRNYSLYIPPDASYVHNLVENIGKEFNSTQLLSQQTAAGYLSILLSYILRNKSLGQSAMMQQPTIQLTEKILKFISENYKRDISLKDIANEFGYSVNYISTLFKDNSGIGYKKYITLQRMKNAENLLRTTTKSIYIIAEECGFNDSNYFSTFFKKFHGMSPKDYRSSIRG